jgi:hypothetical protein
MALQVSYSIHKKLIKSPETVQPATFATAPIVLSNRAMAVSPLANPSFAVKSKSIPIAK